jgi:hypothetical protein
MQRVRRSARSRHPRCGELRHASPLVERYVEESPRRSSASGNRLRCSDTVHAGTVAPSCWVRFSIVLPAVEGFDTSIFASLANVAMIVRTWRFVDDAMRTLPCLQTLPLPVVGFLERQRARGPSGVRGPRPAQCPLRPPPWSHASHPRRAPSVPRHPAHELGDGVLLSTALNLDPGSDGA